MDWTRYLFGFTGRVLYKQFAERLPDSYLVLPLAVIVFVF